MEAGQRALNAEPLPTTGGALPASDDGPDEALLEAAVETTEPSDTTTSLPTPTGTPGARPRPAKVRPSTAFGAYMHSGSAAAGRSRAPLT
eukprot:5371447-Alexandrium_andersonii.AAC.1